MLKTMLGFYTLRHPKTTIYSTTQPHPAFSWASAPVPVRQPLLSPLEKPQGTNISHTQLINLEFVNPLLSKLTLAGYEVNVGKPWQTYRLNHGQSLRSLDAQNPAKLGCPSYKLVYVGL
jgi:hypothetical protein